MKGKAFYPDRSQDTDYPQMHQGERILKPDRCQRQNSIGLPGGSPAANVGIRTETVTCRHSGDGRYDGLSEKPVHPDGQQSAFPAGES